MTIAALALRLAALAALLLAVPFPTSAQDVRWARSGGGTGVDGDYGARIAVDAAGNAYVTGRFDGAATFGGTVLTGYGAFDAFVVKYDPEGAVLWARHGGSDGSDQAEGIAVDAAGNAYVTGQFEGTATFGTFSLTSVGSTDVFVVKYSPAGDVLWARRGGGVNGEHGTRVALGADGAAYVAGAFNGVATFGSTVLTSAGSTDVFVVKYDPDGDVLWARRGGGAEADYARGVAVDGAGEAYVTGSFKATATFGTFDLTSGGGSDVFLAKYAAGGDVLWARGGGGPGFFDQGEGVAVDASGNAYVAGQFGGTATFGASALTSAGAQDVFLVKYAPSGDVLRVARGGGSGDDQGYDVAVDASGAACVTGAFRATATFGAFPLVSSGGGPFAHSIFLVKYDAAGDVLWARSGGPAGDRDQGEGAAMGADGEAYFTGSFTGTATFGPHTLTSAGSADVFVTKLSASASVTVDAAPVSPPVVVPPTGGAFEFTVTLTNVTGQPQTIQAWTAVTGPVSRALVLGPKNVTLPPGATLVRTVRQPVPAAAPPGTYTYHVLVGRFGSAVTAGGRFTFEKGAGVAAASPPEAGAGAGWTPSGWEEDGGTAEAVTALAAAALPGGYALSEAHPNPFDATTRLTLEVDRAQRVRAEVFDGLGRRVAVLLDGEVAAGAHALAFDGSSLPTGVYLVRVTGEAFAASRQVTLVR
ncbi:MAG TPA: SBBP repeat-containing protein [Rubricoccaceae bacterium]|nr:SBBP repeat-containing protein [Rubricoccaceae bacterium]